MLNVEVTVCESSSSLRRIRKKAQADYRLYPQTSCSIRQHSHNRVADKIFHHWMNAGVYHLSSDVMRYLPRIGNIENTAFPTLSMQGNLHAIKYTRVFWHSIDSHKDIEECVDEMKSAKYKRFLLMK